MFKPTVKKEVKLEVELEVDVLEVGVGEVVTVWLDISTPEKFQRKQVELRVTSDGVPEIFSDVPSKDFSHWKPLKELQAL